MFQIANFLIQTEFRIMSIPPLARILFKSRPAISLLSFFLFAEIAPYLDAQIERYGYYRQRHNKRIEQFEIVLPFGLELDYAGVRRHTVHRVAVNDGIKYVVSRSPHSPNHVRIIFVI